MSVEIRLCAMFDYILRHFLHHVTIAIYVYIPQAKVKLGATVSAEIGTSARFVYTT